MGHAHQLAVGGGDKIDFLMYLFGLFFHHQHGEYRCTGGHVTGPNPDTVGGHHAGSGIAFGRTERDSRRQGTGGIQQLRPFGAESACCLTDLHDFRQEVTQFPAEAFAGDMSVIFRDPSPSKSRVSRSMGNIPEASPMPSTFSR